MFLRFLTVGFLSLTIVLLAIFAVTPEVFGQSECGATQGCAACAKKGCQEGSVSCQCPPQDPFGTCEVCVCGASNGGCNVRCECQLGGPLSQVTTKSCCPSKSAGAGASSPIVASYVSHASEPQPDGKSAGALTYRLQNTAKSALVAIALGFEIETDAGNFEVVETQTDSWYTGSGFVLGGQTVTRVGGLRCSVSRGRIVSATPVVQYAELADGTQYGDKTVGAALRDTRTEGRLAYERIAAAFKAGGEPYLRMEIDSSDRSAGRFDALGFPIMAGQAAKMRIEGIWNQDGLTAAIAEAERIAKLTVP